MPKPLEIKLYNDAGKVEKTFTRSFVPWRIMKRAARLVNLDLEKLTPEAVDEMTALVVDVFGDQFSVEDLNNKAKPDEMVTVMTGIMELVGGGKANPPLPGE